jgi:type I restriction enzyme, S subunit
LVPESLVGEVPAGWELTTLGDVCARAGGGIQTGPFGSQLHASDYVPVGIPTVMPLNIGENRIVIEGIARITPADAHRLARHQLLPGDIVYSRRGDVERRALVREGETGWLCGTGCLRVRPGIGVVDSTYVSYYLGHPAVRGWVVRHAIGATMPNLNTAILSALPFVRPPSREQRGIAAVLSSLDDKIELNRRMNQTLEAMAQALFKSWFVDFDPVRAKAAGREPAGMDAETAALFPDSFEDSVQGGIPWGWQVGPLIDFIDVNPPRSLRASVMAPYLDMANMPTESARAINVYERLAGSGARFIDGDTLVARITPCLENGKTAFVDFLGPSYVGWGSTEYIVLRPKPPLPEEFAYFLARTEEFRTVAISNMTGSSGRQRVPADVIKRFSIVIPDHRIGNAFGTFARSALRTMKSNDDQSQSLAAIRDALLPKLLSGEIRVGEANRVVEAAR